MKKLIIYPLSVIATTLVLMTAGCSKTTPTAFVGFHFHTYIYDTVVDPNLYPYQAFPDSFGRIEHLSVAEFYVSNIAFRNKSNQQWVSIPGALILKRIDNEVYPLGNIPAGTYDDIQFTIGLGNSYNSQLPSAFSTSSGYDTVLSVREQSVMWGSGAVGTSATTGYTFMNVQGYDSTDHLPFSYQIGGYGDTVNITMPYPAGFTIAANEPGNLQLVHVLADYGKLLQVIRPVNPTNNISSFYGTSPAPAATLWQNIINIFRYECPVPNGDC